MGGIGFIMMEGIGHVLHQSRNTRIQKFFFGNLYNEHEGNGAF